MSRQLSFHWNDHMDVLVELQNFLTYNVMVDVTLACDGQSIKAHKVLLSACSPFFKNLFLENPCQHPIVILKDVKYPDLKAVIDFMYQGQMKISEDMLPSLLETAQILKVKGLEDLMSVDRFDRANNDLAVDDCENQSAVELMHNESDDELEAYQPEIKQEVLSDDDATNPSALDLLVPSQFQIPATNATNSHQKSPPNQQLVEEDFRNRCHSSISSASDSEEQILTSSNLSNQSSEPSNIEQPHCSWDHNSNLLPFVDISADFTSVDNQQQKSQPASLNRIRNKVKPKKNHFLKMKEYVKSKKSTVLGKGKPIKTLVLKTGAQGQNGPKNADDLSSENVGNSESSIPKLKIKRWPDSHFQATSLNKSKHTSVNRKKEKFQCNQCMHVFNWKGNLNRHFIKVHGKDKLDCCKLCSYKTALMDELKRHNLKKHGKRETFKCLECDFNASKRADVTAHLKAVHGGRKQFTCPVCGLKFAVKEDVLEHLNTHGERK